MAASESQKGSRSKCLEMLTHAPIMEYDARSLSHGLFCSIVYVGVEGVNFTGGSAHHLLLKSTVATAANAIWHAWAPFKQRPCITNLSMEKQFFVQ